MYHQIQEVSQISKRMFDEVVASILMEPHKVEETVIQYKPVQTTAERSVLMFLDTYFKGILISVCFYKFCYQN